MAEPYTPERAYRWSVLPFGMLLIAGGIAALLAPLYVPSDLLRLSEKPFTNSWMGRAGINAFCILQILIGIGFCLRSKVAWWSYFAFLLAATVWQAAFGVDNSHIAGVVLAFAFNIPFGIGIYFATKPAFASVSN